MEEYPTLISIPGCAWNSELTKYEIKDVIRQDNRLSTSELNILLVLLEAQNMGTGQLNITDEGIRKRTRHCIKTIQKVLHSFRDKLGTSYIIRSYRPSKFRKRRQLIIYWDMYVSMLEKLNNIQYRENVSITVADNGGPNEK